MKTFVTLPLFYLPCPKWVKLLPGTSLGSLTHLETTDLVWAPPQYPRGNGVTFIKGRMGKTETGPLALASHFSTSKAPSSPSGLLVKITY